MAAHNLSPLLGTDGVLPVEWARGGVKVIGGITPSCLLSCHDEAGILHLTAQEVQNSAGKALVPHRKGQGRMANKPEAIAVSGSLAQALSTLTVPTLLAQIAQTVGWLSEVYFVSQLGEAATAAVGAVGQVGWVLTVLTIMVSVGATTMTAQRWGAGDADGAKSVTIVTLQQGIFFSVVAMLIWIVREPFWQWLGITPGVQRLATAYFAVALFSFPFMSLAFSLMALYRGIGDMMTPLFATLAGVVVQLLLNMILVPLWGIKGAAAALAISRSVALLWLAQRFWGSPLYLPTRNLLGWRPQLHRELLSLGIPAGLQSLLWSLASIVYFAILAHTQNSTAVIAALTAGLRLEALAFMPGLAFATATQTLVGQNVGARQWERARKGAWQASFWCVAVMTLMSVVFLTAADWLANRFTTDPLTHRYIATYLRINALGEPFLGLGMTLSGALRGTGDTRTPALIGIATHWMMRLPATYWLCHGLGYDAVAAWWTMSLSTIFGGVLTAWAFGRMRMHP